MFSTLLTPSMSFSACSIFSVIPSVPFASVTIAIVIASNPNAIGVLFRSVNSPNSFIFPGKTFSETIPLSPSNGNFTLEQIRQIYKREYNEGLHLNNYVTPDCIATYQRGKGKIPERAIKITLNHLEEMMIKEWLKYPGWPDSFHGF